jgi:hypothetical protein
MRIVAALHAVSKREFSAIEGELARTEKINETLSRRLTRVGDLSPTIAKLSVITFILVFIVDPQLLHRQWTGQPNLALAGCTLAILMAPLILRDLEKRFGRWRLGRGFKLQFLPVGDGADPDAPKGDDADFIRG